MKLSLAHSPQSAKQFKYLLYCDKKVGSPTFCSLMG